MSNFCVLCVHFKNFINFQLKKANFHSNLTKFTRNDPLFWDVYTKKDKFFGIPHAHPMTLFFYEILHPFLFSSRHLSATFTFKCPPPARNGSIIGVHCRFGCVDVFCIVPAPIPSPFPPSLKEYSVIVTTSFYDKNQMILMQKVISKISVDFNISFTSYA